MLSIEDDLTEDLAERIDDLEERCWVLVHVPTGIRPSTPYRYERKIPFRNSTPEAFGSTIKDVVANAEREANRLDEAERQSTADVRSGTLST